MGCCATCFGDPHLKEVIDERASERGTCAYCRSADVTLVAPSALRDLFELVLGIYTEHGGDGGQPLVTWLRNDWAMFLDNRMDDAHAKEVLADVLDDGDVVRRPFTPSPQYVSNAIQEWDDFREEILRRNRFFPAKKPNVDSLEPWLPSLVVVPQSLGGTFFRARLQEGDRPIPLDEMGVPPVGKASNGRANPIGIPYLYLASDADTAVSEVRPHTGELAWVARFEVTRELKLIDLRNPRRTVSPFLLEDEQQVGTLRRSLELFSLLGEELTRPVVPSAAHIDYLPSQYLCEFIKHQAYDGVVYRSSVGSGFNLALFDPASATALDHQRYHVDCVSVAISVAP